jgi:HEAT repeat protein
MTTTATLSDLRRGWERWAAGADKSEDGWQADYPAWDALMAATILAMTQPSPSPRDLDDIAFCWAISEENEQLADYARDHVERCWASLRHLAGSAPKEARWQAYDVLGFAGPRAEALLRAGLDDPDPYCRRRALLSLARLAPADARSLATRFLRDADPYLRQAAIEMVLAANDAAFAREAGQHLLADEAAHVRDAARHLVAQAST